MITTRKTTSASDTTLVPSATASLCIRCVTTIDRPVHTTLTGNISRGLIDDTSPHTLAKVENSVFTRFRLRRVKVVAEQRDDQTSQQMMDESCKVEADGPLLLRIPNSSIGPGETVQVQ